MTDQALVVLLLIEVKHFLFDFVWQTPWQLANKGRWGHPGGLVHSGLHAAATAAVLLAAGVEPTTLLLVALGEFAIHYHIDWGKEQIVRRLVVGQGADFWRLIGLDQLCHQLTYVLILAVLFR